MNNATNNTISDTSVATTIQIRDIVNLLYAPIMSIKAAVEANTLVDIAFGNPYAIQLDTKFSFTKEDFNKFLERSSENDKRQILETLKPFGFAVDARFPIEKDYSDIVSIFEAIAANDKIDGTCIPGLLEVFGDKLTKKQVSRGKLSSRIGYSSFGLGFVSTILTCAGLFISSAPAGLTIAGLVLMGIFTVLAIAMRSSNLINRTKNQNNYDLIDKLTKNKENSLNRVINLMIELQKKNNIATMQQNIQNTRTLDNNNINDNLLLNQIQSQMNPNLQQQNINEQQPVTEQQQNNIEQQKNTNVPLQSLENLNQIKNQNNVTNDNQLKNIHQDQRIPEIEDQLPQQLQQNNKTIPQRTQKSIFTDDNSINAIDDLFPNPMQSKTRPNLQRQKKTQNQGYDNEKLLFKNRGKKNYNNQYDEQENYDDDLNTHDSINDDNDDLDYDEQNYDMSHDEQDDDLDYDEQDVNMDYTEQDDDLEYDEQDNELENYNKNNKKPMKLQNSTYYRKEFLKNRKNTNNLQGKNNLYKKTNSYQNKDNVDKKNEKKFLRELKKQRNAVEARIQSVEKTIEELDKKNNLKNSIKKKRSGLINKETMDKKKRKKATLFK